MMLPSPMEFSIDKLAAGPASRLSLKERSLKPSSFVKKPAPSNSRLSPLRFRSLSNRSVKLFRPDVRKDSESTTGSTACAVSRKGGTARSITSLEAESDGTESVLSVGIGGGTTKTKSSSSTTEGTRGSDTSIVGTAATDRLGLFSITASTGSVLLKLSLTATNIFATGAGSLSPSLDTRLSLTSAKAPLLIPLLALGDEAAEVISSEARLSAVASNIAR
mmetsp:Transcript_29498/g.40533  ORF Transcript_29498/g.40533 Transcript_29498/m.40533 type:complete len:220 (+) Transcript_29498:2126-2785(+)